MGSVCDGCPRRGRLHSAIVGRGYRCCACIYRRILNSGALQLGRSQEHSKSPRARFDLEFATQIFDDPTLERVDDRRDYGELRVVALGVAQGIMLTVVYTDRVEAGGEINRRIISARKSSRREREAYNKHLGRT